MKTTVTIDIDTDSITCSVTETRAETVDYPICTDSYETIASSVAEAVKDYLEGLG